MPPARPPRGAGQREHLNRNRMKLARRYAISKGTASFCVVIASLLLLSVVAWPSTKPILIRLRVHVIGARLTYGPLAYDDSRWQTVLDGVASGDASWLHVAADLEPALDTHPGEDMIGAVSRAFDKNPAGALMILLPRYGAGIVCGQDQDGGVISYELARRRLDVLKTIPFRSVDGLALDRCYSILASARQGKVISE